MRFHFINVLAALLGTSLATTPLPPGLSYLGRFNATLNTPVAVGVGQFGDRNFFAITGGTFTGPVFNATILPYGGDWSLGDPTKGSFYVDARYHLKTADGANIYGESNGPQQDLTTVHTRVRFESGHEKYKWLNKVVGVGIIAPGEGLRFIVADMWKVETPKGE